MYVIQSKNGIVINVGVSVENEMIEVLEKMIVCEILVNRIFSCKINKYLNMKNCSCKKRLIVKLVLEYEDEILNATKTSLDDTKETRDEINCLIHTISLVIICLLLLVVIFIIKEIE